MSKPKVVESQLKPEPGVARVSMPARIMAAREKLRSSLYSATFEDSERSYVAASIHLLAKETERALADQQVIAIFDLQSWSRQNNTTIVEGQIRLIATDSVGEPDEIRVNTVGEAFDLSDKGLGKAISSARKNGLIAALNLAIGIDIEGQPKQEASQASENESSQAKLFTFVFDDGSERSMSAIEINGSLIQLVQSAPTVKHITQWMTANAETLARYRSQYPEIAKRLDDALAATVARLRGTS